MSNRDSKGRFVKAKALNVGDNVRGYSRVQKKWLEGKITDITLGDDIQTYELGFGNWISKRHKVILLEPAQPCANPSAPQPKAEEAKAEAPAFICTHCNARWIYKEHGVDGARELGRKHILTCEKNPLVQEIASLQSEIGSLKAEAERLANSRDGWALDATTSKRRLEAAEAEISDLKALLRASRIIKGICASGLDDAISRVLGQS